MTGNRKQQSGVALIIGLVMLLLLTIIMLAAMRVTSLEERMAGNLRNQNIAFQAAESALREAEARIDVEDELVNWDRDADGTLEPNPFYWLYRDGTFKNTRDALSASSEDACAFGLCTPTPLSRADLATLVETDDAMLDASTNIATVSAEPKYVIQLLDQVDSPDNSRLYATFLITAVAWGGDDNRTLVQLQSTYRLHSRHKVD